MQKALRDMEDSALWVHMADLLNIQIHQAATPQAKAFYDRQISAIWVEFERRPAWVRWRPRGVRGGPSLYMADALSAAYHD